MHNVVLRTNRKKYLLAKTREFAQESAMRSRLEFWGTVFLILGNTVILSFAASLPFLVVGIALQSLLLLRLFMIYHDYLHRAILRYARLEGFLLNCFGYVVLSPPPIWEHGHNKHHRDNCRHKNDGAGEFPLMFLADYVAATPRGRLCYRLARHPIVILLGYIFVFAWTMCLRAFFKAPIRNLSGGISILVHIAIGLLLYMVSVKWLLVFLVIPMTIITGVGALLFYVQHNFPSAVFQNEEEWDYVFAALNSSSYLKMPKVLAWFTANIGCHHIHHLNSKIPFYKLSTANESIQATNCVRPLTLSLRNIIECFRCNIWCSETKKWLTFRDAADFGGRAHHQNNYK